MLARTPNRIIGIIALAPFWAGSQDGVQRIQEIVAEDVRVVAPLDAPLLERDAQRLIRAYQSQAPLDGLPAKLVAGSRMTIVLATSMGEHEDGRASPRQRRIVLPRHRVLTWSPEKTHRVIRHELAHVALGEFLDHGSTPRWFDEGYAEWVSGEMSCEAQARVSMAVEVADVQRESGPRLRADGHPERRVSYDLWRTFFEFLEDERELVSNGRLLAAVRSHGVEAGIQEATGSPLLALEKHWHEFLDERYGGRTSCQRSRWSGRE